MHSQITVRNQMNVLNSAYGPSGFYFKLVFSELVFNTAWCAFVLRYIMTHTNLRGANSAPPLAPLLWACLFECRAWSHAPAVSIAPHTRSTTSSC